MFTREKHYAWLILWVYSVLVLLHVILDILDGQHFVLVEHVLYDCDVVPVLLRVGVV